MCPERGGRAPGGSLKGPPKHGSTAAASSTPSKQAAPSALARLGAQPAQARRERWALKLEGAKVPALLRGGLHGALAEPAALGCWGRKGQAPLGPSKALREESRAALRGSPLGSAGFAPSFPRSALALALRSESGSTSPRMHARCAAPWRK